MFEREIQVLKALANGVNYFTGEQCKDESVLNDPNIIRTLYEVCEQLRGIAPEKMKKGDFICPFDIEEKFEYEEELCITKIIDKIFKMYPNMKKIKLSQIMELLVQRGLVTRVIGADGKSTTVATEQAAQFGIYNKQRTSMYGKEYHVVTYNKSGQQLVLSIIKEL